MNVLEFRVKSQTAFAIQCYQVDELGKNGINGSNRYYLTLPERQDMGDVLPQVERNESFIDFCCLCIAKNLRSNILRKSRPP